MHKLIEVSAVVLASLVAAFASLVGLFTLWEVQDQSDQATRQLQQIEEQSRLLSEQLRINEELVSNDSALTFLTLLESMRPEWDFASDIEVAVGGQDGYERYNADTVVMRFEITNEGRLPMVISDYHRIAARSCVDGRWIDFADSGEPSENSADGAAEATPDWLGRTTTISPGETRTIWTYFDILGQPDMASIRLNQGEFFLTFRSLVYSEGADVVDSFLGPMDELDAYFTTLFNGDEEVQSPFLATFISGHSWLRSDGQVIIHSSETQNCSIDELLDREARSQR